MMIYFLLKLIFFGGGRAGIREFFGGRICVLDVLGLKKKQSFVLNHGETWQKWKCSSPQPHHHNVPPALKHHLWRCVFSDGFLPMEDPPMFCGGKLKKSAREQS